LHHVFYTPLIGRGKRQTLMFSQLTICLDLTCFVPEIHHLQVIAWKTF